MMNSAVSIGVIGKLIALSNGFVTCSSKEFMVQLNDFKTIFIKTMY